MDPKQFVEVFESIYSSHNPSQISLDAHLDAELSNRGLQETVDGEFIFQVVYGAFRYSRFLNAFLEAFYHHNRCVLIPEAAVPEAILGPIYPILPASCCEEVEDVLTKSKCSQWDSLAK